MMHSLINQSINLFTMGGYGLYVWSAYGITGVVFAINIVACLYEKHQVKKRLRAWRQLS